MTDQRPELCHCTAFPGPHFAGFRDDVSACKQLKANDRPSIFRFTYDCWLIGGIIPVIWFGIIIDFRG